MARQTKRVPDRRTLAEINETVASRIRERRILLGMTQERLAQQVGLSFQQVYKYEQGQNYIGAARLQQFADALGVQVGFFYRTVQTASKSRDSIKLTRTEGQVIRGYRKLSPELRRIVQAICKLGENRRSSKSQ